MQWRRVRPLRRVPGIYLALAVRRITGFSRPSSGSPVQRSNVRTALPSNPGKRVHTHFTRTGAKFGIAEFGSLLRAGRTPEVYGRSGPSLTDVPGPGRSDHGWTTAGAPRGVDLVVGISVGAAPTETRRADVSALAIVVTSGMAAPRFSSLRWAPTPDLDCPRAAPGRTRAAESRPRWRDGRTIRRACASGNHACRSAMLFRS